MSSFGNKDGLPTDMVVWKRNRESDSLKSMW